MDIVTLWIALIEIEVLEETIIPSVNCMHSRRATLILLWFCVFFLGFLLKLSMIQQLDVYNGLGKPIKLPSSVRIPKPSLRFLALSPSLNHLGEQTWKHESWSFLFSLQAELLVFAGSCWSLLGIGLEFLCQGHHYLHNNTDFYTLDGEPVGCSAVWSETLHEMNRWFGRRVIWQRTWGHAAGEGGLWWFDRMIHLERYWICHDEKRQVIWLCLQSTKGLARLAAKEAMLWKDLHCFILFHWFAEVLFSSCFPSELCRTTQETTWEQLHQSRLEAYLTILWLAMEIRTLDPCFMHLYADGFLSWRTCSSSAPFDVLIILKLR